MDTDILTQLLYCFCVLSALLLLGTFLRAVIPPFRKLFLPASVIGGFIGLLIGPILWGNTAVPHMPFPDTWIDIWTELPSLLIVPVVASVPLGMKVRQKGEPKKKSNTSSNVTKMFLVISAATVFQGVIGMFTQTVFNGFGSDLYETFGYELPSGFSGGHGTAGILGSTYKDMGLDFWATAQGVATTTATFGLIGGMIIGIIAINIAARKGNTAILKKPGDIPLDVQKGYQMDIEKQNSLGRETTMNSSIEPITFHLAIILGGCGLAYLALALVNYLNIPLIGNIAVWAYAIVIMLGVNYVLQRIGLGNLIDSKTKSRIAGTFSDYAITAAIASLPVQAVMSYLLPILFMVVIGYACTYLIITWICKRVFKDYLVERSMACFGSCTGVFLTGLMLLRLCDPDFESPVLNDYSVGYSFVSIVSFVLMTLFISLMLTYSSLVNMFIQLGVFLIFIAFIFIITRASDGTQKEASA